MSESSLKARNNAAFDLTYHLVLVTKWRRKALNPAMLGRFGIIAASTLEDWRCELVEHGGEADHVHVLFRGHPAMDLSRLVNNLKTVTSRLLRKEFASELSQFYWKPVLWHGAYYIGSVGHASMDTVRK
ncbi:MAG: IS200/IS605 family transposase, partial [Proteobacteria bacterium]|nr:IS200/IS605 family transposase [Pseudomonadota bacterium]